MTELHPFEPTHQAFAAELGRAACDDPRRGVGYPRWETWDEVLAEFAVYSSTPAAGLYIASVGG